MSVSARHTQRIACAFVCLLAACGGDKTVAPVVLADALRGVTVSPSTGSVIAGQTLTLSAVPDPASAGVVIATTFASGTPAVATVSAAGVVSGVSAGTSVITVSSTGSGTGFTSTTKTATATITVLPAPDALRGLTTTPASGSIVVGQTLSITTTPDVAATSITVSNAYASASPTVATVSPTGVVTAVSVGSSIITVTATGSGTGYTTTTKTATTLVTVFPAPDALRSVTVSPAGGVVFAGRTLNLTTVTDVAATTVAVTTSYTSGTPAVAAVSATGVVTGVTVGTTVITVTATGSGAGFTTTSKTASATISVTQAPDALLGVTMTPATASVIVGSTLALTVVPDVASTSVTVSNTFSSATPAVATVSTAGVVTGVAAGTSIITVVATGTATGFTTTSKTTTTTITVAPPIFAADQFVLAPAGTFVMGTIAGGADSERPAHTVTLSAFQIQKTELTQGQWRAVMGGNPSANQPCGPSCPVESVSWDDIQTFITRLNQLDPGKGYRLPTEAQWEYAARAGTTSEYGAPGTVDDIGWYDGNSGRITKPAAQKRANAWGLFDMSGNVLELVQDFYSLTYYASSAAIDPLGPATGTDRVTRGGSVSSPSSNLRSAYRSSRGQSQPASAIGCRLVRDP